MLLCFPQCFSIHHIELYMMSILAKIASDQCRQTIIAVLILKKLRGKFLVEKCASRPQVINF